MTSSSAMRLRDHNFQEMVSGKYSSESEFLALLHSKFLYSSIFSTTYSNLVVTFTSETIEEVEKFITYKLQNFIADIGGLLGLFMGCSLISIVEIFFFISHAIFSKSSENTKMQEKSTLEIRVDRNHEETKKTISNFMESAEAKFEFLLLEIRQPDNLKSSLNNSESSLHTINLEI